MKKLYHSLVVLFCSLLLVQCRSFDRISALRILDIRFTDDLLNVVVSAEIIDSEKKNGITDHGFCYTAGYALPTLGDGISDTLSLGEVSDENLPFEGKITRLVPSTDYYIRAYITVNGKTVYSSPKFIRTRDFIPNDFDVLVTNAVISENQVIVDAFVNRKRIESRNLTITQYGSIVAAEPDSTKGLSIAHTNIPPDPITYFTDEYSVSVLPTPATPPDSFYIWAYADVYFDQDITLIYRIYSRKRIVKKLN